ncbi:hypothetical protein LTR64_005515 [Lithohypha guttulata]|uniref:uncharacterized protein n=1 Tax=Lithohypha guttulata TaxID=1690604 RepID=UPI00315CB497
MALRWSNLVKAQYESARVSQERTEEDSYEAVTLNNLLVPNLELSTNCHPSFPANVAPTVTGQSISQRVLSLLHSSRFVSIASLEIRHTSDPAASGSAGLDPDDPAYVEPEKDVLKAYWTLYIDCVALSYGGEANAFDTTVMAVIAALKDVRIPQARWDEDSKQIFCSPDYTKARTLELRGLPCPLSFGVFEPDSRIKFDNEGAEVNGTATPSKQKSQGATILLDIDYFESDVCTEKGNIVVDWSSRSCRILRLEKVGGGGVLGLEGIKQIVDSAEKRCQEWKAVLDGASGSGG